MTQRLHRHISRLIIALAVVATACNSDPEETTVSTYENTAVDGFSLAANDKILTNLDSVYFSIDLNSNRIFNADSLPKGTDVSRLVVKVSASNVALVELTAKRGERGDTTYNYTANQNDSIDFSHGPVEMRVVARNGNQRYYTVTVNVHRMDPDSLYWNRSAVAPLPTLLGEPVAQKTVELDGKAVTLTTDATGAACMAVTANPADGWETRGVALPAGADVRSLTAMNSRLALLDGSGRLHTAPGPFDPWTPEDASFSALIGAYGTCLLGISPDRSAITAYPAGSIDPMPLPEGFPVAGMSTLVSFTSSWATMPMAVTVGGVDGRGEPTGACWAFDGTTWERLNPRSPLTAAEGITLVPYFAFRTDRSTWTVTEQSVLLALGGRQADGAPSRAVSISWDRGITWIPATTNMKLPEAMAPFHSADAVVLTSLLSASGRSAALWTPVASAPPARWWRLAAPEGRAVAPITEWECPYIYLFGGVDASGALLPDVWRGVINRLTFTPLY